MTQLSIFQRKSPMELLIEELATEGDPDGLRYYQREAYQAVLDSLAGHRSTLVVMATGLGKTQLFCAVGKHYDGSVLIVAHRDELIDQARRRVEQMTGEYVEIEKAECVSSSRTRIVVGSVQSLNKKRLERLGKNRFKLIIVDEAHHATAPSYKRLFEHFDAKVLGVTATPDRTDEKALGKVFDDVAYVFDIADGIKAGYLVPLGDCHEGMIKEFDLDAIKKQAGDLAANELDQEMLRHVEAVVKGTLDRHPNRTGICFFPGVKSADLAAQRFNALKPNSAAFVSGATNEFERKRIMADFRAKRIQFLCNCMVATEGFDAPATDLIVQARPTLSRALYAQMMGRGTRVLEKVVDKYEGQGLASERRAAIAKSHKPNLAVLDFVGNSKKHDLVGPVDVLGGNYTEAEVKAAKKLAKQGVRPAEALETARRQLRTMAEAMKKAQAQVTIELRPFDPFRSLGIRISDDERYESGRFSKPATAKQLVALAAWGVRQDELNQLSCRAASKLMGKLIARKEHGYCSLTDLQTLQRFGVTELGIRREQARNAINYIRQAERRGNVDSKIVQEIATHRRVAGED